MASSASVKAPAQLSGLLSTRGKNLPAPRVGDPRKSADLISFIYGFPDPDSLPVQTMAESTARAVAKDPKWALQYGKTTGVPVLVDALIEKLAKDQGIVAKPEQVMITSGGSQACQLVIDLLVDPEDTVLVEAPTWMGFLYMVNTIKGKCVGVPLDEHGMDVDALEATLKRLKGEGVTPKLIYVIPNFQNPSGISTTLERRQRIVELAREYGTIVLEDDAYYDLRFSGEKITPMYNLDDSGSVWYTGTFSKNLGAGIRLGWLVAPESVISTLSVLKTDGCSSVFGSHAAAEWIPEHLDSHVDTLTGIYRRRRDLMLEALERHMPAGTTWTTPDGGFFIWVTMPEGLDAARMLPMARERGVEFLAGSTCFADGSHRNTMRLSFSFAKDDQIDPGIRVIGEIATGELKETGKA